MADIAKKVHSTFVFDINMRKYYDCNGKPLDEKTSRLLFGKVREYNKAASEYSRENTVDKDANVKDFCYERIRIDKDVKGGKMRELVESGIDMLSGIAACDLDKLSLKYYWMEDDLPVTPSLSFPKKTLMEGRETVSRFHVRSDSAIHRSSLPEQEPHQTQYENNIPQHRLHKT